MKEAPCPKCSSPVSLEAYEIEVSNTPRLSLASLAHHCGVDCPSCGTYLLPGIVSLNVDVAFRPAERPAEAARVVGVSALPLSLVQ